MTFSLILFYVLATHVLLFGQIVESVEQFRLHFQLHSSQAVGLVPFQLISLVHLQLQGAGEWIGFGSAWALFFGEEIQGGSIFLVFCHGYIYYELNPNSCWRLPNVGGNSHRFRHGSRRQIISARDPCHG